MESSPALPTSSSAPAPAPAATPALLPLPRWFAMFQAFMVCGVPTGFFLVIVMMWSGLDIESLARGEVTLKFFAMYSLFDTALIAMLIYVFLRLSGETSEDVFFGRRPVGREILLGLKLVPAAFLAVITLVVALRTIFPSLHNVKTSPLEAFLGNPVDAGIFLVVVVLAGGVREELQRAFILHRFDQALGGVKLGLAVFSITFGLLHLDQGYDVAMAIGLLGLLWGVLYVTRRSAIAPMVNHAAFNAAQVLQAIVVRAIGL